jgi:hypothetical protein
MTTKPDCYGTMFPDLTVETFNVPHEGKAFTLSVESSGGAVTERHSTVKMEEWLACTECPAYRSCYDLCVGRMLLHRAAQSYGLERAL